MVTLHLHKFKLMFRKVLYILWVIFLATPALLGGPIEKELEEYHKEGVRQLKELIRSNEWNDAHGLSHQNNYIFSFERKDKWLKERKEDGSKEYLLSDNEYDEINNVLQAYNTKPDVTNLYVCLVNEWPIALIKKMDESITSTSEWTPYTVEIEKKEIVDRFNGLIDGIVKEALKDYPNSSTFAVAKFIGNYLDTDGKVKYQHGYLRQLKLKPSVPNRENIKPSLVPIAKSIFFDRLKKNVESIINELNEKQELVNDAILAQIENKPATDLVLPPQLVKESFQIVEHLKVVSGEEAALLLKSEVEDFAKVLKDGLSQYPHEKARKYKDDEYYHILNIDKLFSFQFFGENKKGYRVLEDRLRYLYEEENVEVYAVYKEVDFVFDDPNTFAANVLNSIKDKIGNRKVVLVTIPYCYPKKSITGVRAQYVMPGLAATHSNILDKGVIDGHPFENTFQLLYSVYSNLEKPCRIYYAILQADGTPIFSVEDLGRKRNYPFINGVYYLVNPGIQTVRSLPAPYLKTYLDGNLHSDHDNSPDPVLWNERNKYNGQPQLEVSEAWSQYYLDRYQYNITRQSLIDEYNVNKPNRSWEKASNNIKEKYIPDYYMAYGIHMVFQESGMIKFLHSVNELMISEGEFSQLGLGVLFQFQAYKNLHTVLGGSPLSYADIAYDFEVSSVLNSIVFLTIDIVGLIPGVDQIADAVGVGYSWLVGDQNNANAYLIGLAVMGGGTLVVKGVQKYGKHIYKGTIYVLDATGKVVRKISASSEKRIAQLANLFNVSDDFIPASQLSQLEGMINNGQVDRRILREILNEPTEAGRITKIKDTFAGKNVLSKVDDGIGTATSGVGMFKRATRLSDETIEVLAKRVDDLKLSPNQIDALVDDLINGSDDFVRAITRNKGELVEAWSAVSKHPNISKHIPSLEKVSDLLNDADFMGKLPNGRADLDGIIDAVKNPLNGGGAHKLVKLADHLENVKQVVKKHSGAEGFDKLMTDLKNPAFAMQDGVTHMLNDVKNFASGKVKKFDYEFNGDGVVCTKCRFDVELDASAGDLKLIEYKSWSLENIPNLSARQMTEYFRGIDNISEMKYVFNKLKTPDLGAIKTQMKSVFSGNAPDIFQSMKTTLKSDLGADNLPDFLDLVNDTNSKLYNFIDIK